MGVLEESIIVIEDLNDTVDFEDILLHSMDSQMRTV